MVYVNSKKFACESCIKGHRSSTCHHTDRPLFEVKKKGRPVSQCEKCRELRQSKRVHSKCNCNSGEGSSTLKKADPASRTKSKRYVPIVPALPNGIKDVFQASQSESTIPSSTRQRVDSLLNPCTCRSLRGCRCQESSLELPANGGLASLARAAELCYSLEPSVESSTPLSNVATSSSCCDRRKRSKHTHNDVPGPELPPVLFHDSAAFPVLDSVPTFATMPSMSEISSLAGSGCTCGVSCNCPGCVEHRGPEHAEMDRPSCAHGCGTCVDNTHGVALPGYESTSASTMIDRFLARAASLPAPPPNRKMGTGAQLDPMNVIVYPSAAMETTAQGIPFGLINIPKLECCGGRCGCPGGRCGCGKSCDGCCAEHAHGKGPEEPKEVRSLQVPHDPPVIRSCCSGS